MEAGKGMKQSIGNGNDTVGVCEKIYNVIKIGPAFRKIRRISHGLGADNLKTKPIPLRQRMSSERLVLIEEVPPPNNDNKKNSVLNSQIPIEHNWSQPAEVNSKKEGESAFVPIPKRKVESAAGPPTKRLVVAPPKPVIIHGEGAMAGQHKISGRNNNNVEDDDHEHIFSDYINRMKNKLRSASNVTAARRDSFNDKVTTYIHHAKLKLRTSTTVGSSGNTVVPYK